MSHGYSVILLDGITGSGKTEVYLESLLSCLERNQQVMILLPQISLVPQVAERFEQRFGVQPTLWHSDLTPAQRRVSWENVCSGAAKVILGARSALFLPYGDLGLIIVDEEHDVAYKQEEGILYQGRDLAVARAYLKKIPCVLASATPSLETLYNCQMGRYHHVTLSARFGEARLPDVHLIDLKEQKQLAHKKTQRQKPEKKWISQELSAHLCETIAAGGQALLYLNRRGYAPLTLCRACGVRLECPHCSTWLVNHLKKDTLLCHYCGHRVPFTETCPSCGTEEALVPCGPGVERVAEEVKERFPHFRTLVMSSDTIESTQSFKDMVRQIQNQEVDIIIGTQMMAKGHHFPHLTLVGVIDADLGLSGGDLRASEKTYQLLHQVAGRAGRGDKPGQVYLQTYTTDHPLLLSLLASDRDSFITQEMHAREQGIMPPFSRLAALVFSGRSAEQVEKTARQVRQQAPQGREDILVVGPAPAPLSLLRGHYRWRILVRTSRQISVQTLMRQWMERVSIPSSVRVKIDIDPYSFL